LPWSPRARPGAGIAFPLSWDQVTPGLNPADYNLWVWPELLQRPDAWSGFRDSAVSLRPALRKMGVD